MINAYSVFCNRQSMFNCWITFVLVPVVKRKFFMNSFHKIVAVSFCQNRRRSNGIIFTISFYNTLMLNIVVWFEAISVYNNKARFLIEQIQGLVHSQERCIEDIYPIYFLMVYCCNRI